LPGRERLFCTSFKDQSFFNAPLIAKNVKTVFVDAAAGPTVSAGCTPGGTLVITPLTGKLSACQFDPDRHLLCLFIEAGS